MERVVHQPHPGVYVPRVGGGLTQMLAEHQGIVARLLTVEYRIAVVVPVAVAVSEIELLLNLAAVPRAAAVLVGPVLLAEEIVRHMLDRIQPQAVAFGIVYQPAGGPDQVGVDVLFVEPRIGRIGKDFGGDVGTTEPYVDRPCGRGIVAVVFRMIRVPHELDLGNVVAFVAPEIAVVRRLVGDVNQVRKVPVLNLPRVAPVRDIIPFAVESFLCYPQVKILRYHAGI